MPPGPTYGDTPDVCSRLDPIFGKILGIKSEQKTGSFQKLAICNKFTFFPLSPLNFVNIITTSFQLPIFMRVGHKMWIFLQWQNFVVSCFLLRIYLHAFLNTYLLHFEKSLPNTLNYMNKNSSNFIHKLSINCRTFEFSLTKWCNYFVILKQ